VVITKIPWISVLALRIHQTLPDHILRDLIVVGPLLFLFLALHTNDLMIIYG
jgi:hypothetical protein